MKKINLDTHYTVSESGCWIWKGGIDKDGYGIMSGNKRAHRVYYEHFCGPIPNAACVCHRCDVRDCVNPAHLFVGTNRYNTLDRTKKGRSARGERNGASKLTENQVLSINADNRSNRELADEYGVTPRVIQLIRNRETWSWLTAA